MPRPDTHVKPDPPTPGPPCPLCAAGTTVTMVDQLRSKGHRYPQGLRITCPNDGSVTEPLPSLSAYGDTVTAGMDLFLLRRLTDDALLQLIEETVDDPERLLALEAELDHRTSR